LCSDWWFFYARGCRGPNIVKFFIISFLDGKSITCKQNTIKEEGKTKENNFLTIFEE